MKFLDNNLIEEEESWQCKTTTIGKLEAHTTTFTKLDLDHQERDMYQQKLLQRKPADHLQEDIPQVDHLLELPIKPLINTETRAISD